MHDEHGFPATQLRRERPLFAKIIFGTAIVAVLLFLSVIVQSLLGDTYLSSEGSFLQAAEQTWCGVATWSPNCSNAANAGSTSTSPSLSTSTSPN